jgi:hypothetical protein
VLEEAADAVDVRAGRDLVRAEVLGEEEVAERVDRVAVGLVDQLAERLALPRQQLLAVEVADADVPQPTGPGEQRAPLLELAPDPRPDVLVREPLLRPDRAAGLDPGRDEDQQAGARPLRGIGVERDVEALASGGVDELEHPVGAARERLAVVEVGDVGRRLAEPADLDRLAERVEEAVAERVADVGVIEAAVPSGLLRQLGQLPGGGVAPRRVVEARAEAERAFLHPLPEQGLHRRPGLGSGRHVVPADRLDAER